MNTNSNTLQVGPVDAFVVRKPIKNLHLSVLPPNGKVRVTAPLHIKDDAIRLLLATRLIWIKRQKAKYEMQERQTPREFVSGETHYYLGEPYRLEVAYVNLPPRVFLKGKNKIVLQVRPNSAFAKREEVLMNWYRAELKIVISNIIEKWSKAIGVQTNAWGVKRMKTRWGTCNHNAGRIWLNLELAKKSIASIEYIIVHELLHLIERRHNNRFIRLLTSHLPKWRLYKEELNRFALSAERWN
jgi:predicted metal-dependent hydrolase